MLFRTAEGTKLLSVVINKRVAFEANGHSLDDGWSVIVQGTAEVPSTSAQIDEADRAGLRAWIVAPGECQLIIVLIIVPGPTRSPAPAFAEPVSSCRGQHALQLALLMIEAIGCGTPVVVVRGGGCRRIVVKDDDAPGG